MRCDTGIVEFRAGFRPHHADVSGRPGSEPFGCLAAKLTSPSYFRLREPAAGRLAGLLATATAAPSLAEPAAEPSRLAGSGHGR
jgi:hypothetical protein